MEKYNSKNHIMYISISDSPTLVTLSNYNFLTIITNYSIVSCFNFRRRGGGGGTFLLNTSFMHQLTFNLFNNMLSVLFKRGEIIFVTVTYKSSSPFPLLL